MFINDRKITISVGSSRKAASWQAQEMYWSEFAEKLRHPVRTHESFADYMALKKSQQDEIKDVGGFVGGVLKGGRRKNENAGERHLVTLDADNIAGGNTQAVLNAVDSLGCAYAVYSTRKHEGAAPRLRIIFPLDTPCGPDEYEPIARKTAGFIGMGIFDPTTFETVRLMYWPSASRDSDYVYSCADKPFLSRQGILGLFTDWHNVAEWPEVPGAAKLRDRSMKKQGNPLEKKGVVGAFCQMYDVPAAIDEFIPGSYEECDTMPGRYTYTEGSTVGGAVLYDNGNFIFSHHATDPAGGRLCNAFDLVRLHKFGDEDEDAKPDTPVTQLPSFRAMCSFAMEVEAVSKQVAAGHYERAQQEFSTWSGTEDGTIDDAGSPDWLKKLKVSSQTGLPAKTIENVKIILENDPRIKNRFYLDEFTNRFIIEQPLPWEPQVNPYRIRLWTDSDDAGLRNYLELIYGLTGEKKIYDALAVYMLNHKRHKLKDYLNGLVWDGAPRIDTLLTDYFGAEDCTYTRLAIRKTLTAAVARIMNPGVKFDCMLILSGLQGVGKSTFFRILGMDWYSDSLSTFEGKDAAELVQGYWIIEAGELTGLAKSERNAVKQFLSKQIDIYRMPYGKRTDEYPRNCIIVGTTNDKEFLKDTTGNRRFWPVDLGLRLPIKNVFRDLAGEVGQIWAEAAARYQIGETLYLDKQAEAEAVRQQEEHRERSPKEGIIRDFIDRRIPADWMQKDLYARRTFWADEFGHADESTLVERNKVCAVEIWCECFNGDIKLMRRQDTLEINSILAEVHGWEKAKGALKFGKPYGAQKGFAKVTL